MDTYVQIAEHPFLLLDLSRTQQTSLKKGVMIDMAKSGATMISSNLCKKTHFVKDRLGQCFHHDRSIVCQDCQPELTQLQEMQHNRHQSDLGFLDEDPDI
jgi:hypothetical protein